MFKIIKATVFTVTEEYVKYFWEVKSAAAPAVGAKGTIINMITRLDSDDKYDIISWVSLEIITIFIMKPSYLKNMV